MDENTVFRFRTAVGGFHKGDVSAYIAKISASHQTAIRNLESEIAALTTENNILREKLEAANAGSDRSVANSEPTDAESLDSMELAAYRRAEAVERTANRRARQMYQDIESVCTDATSQMNQAGKAACENIDAILAHMKSIETIYQRLSAALDADQLKLQSLSSLVPDPAEGLEE